MKSERKRSKNSSPSTLLLINYKQLNSFTLVPTTAHHAWLLSRLSARLRTPKNVCSHLVKFSTRLHFLFPTKLLVVTFNQIKSSQTFFSNMMNWLGVSFVSIQIAMKSLPTTMASLTLSKQVLQRLDQQPHSPLLMFLHISNHEIVRNLHLLLL